MHKIPPLSAYIDLYCERTMPGLFNEPFSVIANIGFLIATYMLVSFARKEGLRSKLVWTLVWLVGFIGIGSTVFHMNAKMWSAVFLDNLPIAVWAILFLIALCKYVLRVNTITTLLLFTIFLVENVAFKALVFKAPDGYVSLIPSIIFLLALSGLMRYDKNPSFKNFFIATLVSVIAVIFRVIDLPLCEEFPLGTHFLWHALMAWFFYIVLKEIARCASAKKKGR